MRREEEARLLRDIGRRQMRNEFRDWLVQARKHPIVAALQVLMGVALVACIGMLAWLVPLLDSGAGAVADTGAARGLGLALLMFVLFIFAALGGVATVVSSPAEATLLLPSPLERRALVLNRHRTGIWVVILTSLGVCLLAGPLGALAGNAPGPAGYARFGAGLAFFGILFLNVSTLLSGMRNRLRPRTQARVDDAVALCLALVTVAAGAQLLRVVLAAPGELHSALGAALEHPAARALLSPLDLALDAMYLGQGATGPAALAALGALAALTTLAVHRYDFILFEPKGFIAGREVRRRPFWRRGPLSDLRLDWPGRGRGAGALFSLGLLLGFRMGAVAMLLIVLLMIIVPFMFIGLIAFGSYGIFLLLLLLLFMTGQMCLGHWTAIDMMLVLPVDRFRQAWSGLLPALVYQLVGFCVSIAVIAVLSPGIPAGTLAMMAALTPPFLFCADALILYDILATRDLDARPVEPGTLPRPDQFQASPSGVFPATATVLALMGTAWTVMWLRDAGLLLMSIVMAVALAGTGYAMLRAAARKLDSMVRARPSKWRRRGTWAAGLAAMVALVVAGGNALAVIELSGHEGSPEVRAPPSVGMLVSDKMELNDTVVYVPDTLFIAGGAVLTLTNVTVRVNCTDAGISGIYCAGELIARNCTFSPAEAGDHIVFRSGWRLRAFDCNFSGLWGSPARPDGGGGLEIFGSASLDNCTVSGGLTNGIFCSGSLWASDCLVADNGDDGVELRGAVGSLSDCRIIRNGRGVMSVGPDYYDYLSVVGCEIRWNRGDGILNKYTDIVVRGSDISDNGGWGISNEGGDLELDSNIIIDNGLGARKYTSLLREPGFGAAAAGGALALALVVAQRRRLNASRPKKV